LLLVGATVGKMRNTDIAALKIATQKLNLNTLAHKDATTILAVYAGAQAKATLGTKAFSFAAATAALAALDYQLQ
jgi:hypothetical protein